MSAPAVSLVTVGSINGTPVNVSLGLLSPTAQIERVLLSQNYTMAQPAGYPARPPCGAASAEIETSATYPAGATIYVFDFEANVIVAAGGGTITGSGYP